MRARADAAPDPGADRSGAHAARVHPEASPREDPPIKSALEGERKQVTVLVAVVKGSMELAEQVDPEE